MGGLRWCEASPAAKEDPGARVLFRSSRGRKRCAEAAFPWKDQTFEFMEYLMLAGTKSHMTRSTTRAAKRIGRKIRAISFSAIPSKAPPRLILSVKIDMAIQTAIPATMNKQVPTTNMSSETILVPNMYSLLC